MTDVAQEGVKILFNEKEAAQMLGMKPATLRTWRCNGFGPNYIKIGHLIRYRMTDIELFIRKSRVKCFHKLGEEREVDNGSTQGEKQTGEACVSECDTDQSDQVAVSGVHGVGRTWGEGMHVTQLLPVSIQDGEEPKS